MRSWTATASLFLIAMLTTAACLPQMMGATAGGYGAGTAAGFAGTYATQGGTITLVDAGGGQVSGTIAGGGVTGQIAGRVDNGQLTGQFTFTDGSSGMFTATPTGDGLQVVVAGRPPIAFVRSDATAAGAATATAAAPDAPDPQVAQILTGKWWHYHSVGSGDSSASFERTIELCRDGTFFDSSASDISVTAKNNIQGYDGWGNAIDGRTDTVARASQGAGAGRWTASGDDGSGQVRLVFNNGTVEDHRYVFQKRGGADIELDGRWYGRTNEGGQCQ